MVTGLKLVLDDTQRKRLNKALGKRGGKAKRADVKGWALRILTDALRGLPEVVEKRAKLDPETSPLRVPPKVKKLVVHYNDVAKDTVCHLCRLPKAEHGMLGYCPVMNMGAQRFTEDGVKLSFVPRPPQVRE